jgi:Secretion system C-terminal sorting domain
MKIYLFIFLFFSFSLLAQDSSKYYFQHHNIGLPIDNKGFLADVTVDEYLGNMRFNNKGVLYSGGFFLSGFSNKTLWANGMASVSNVQDYLPGSYKYPNLDNLAKVYTLKKSDKPFSESWQDWRNAVKLGADFYDGDNDGIYNPIDKNGNGKWDNDEDRPDLLGDQTAWCVYKDSVPSEFRIYFNAKPQGIEIQQTVFASSINESFENTVFIRYRLENVGLTSNILDSVYFSAWSDPDIGYASDDLVGCDTIINAGFVYQNTPDDNYGQSAPTLITSILQGPPIYIPDSTYIDSNNNGYYDEADVPISSAYENNGLVKGVNYTDGAVNSSIISFKQFLTNFHGTNPADEIEVRRLILGFTEQGDVIDPCNWLFGEITNDSCQNINGIFMYSGDPIMYDGWINTKPRDQIMMVNTGPFELEVDKPIDIVVAYIIGYNNQHSLLSLKDAKQKVRNVNLFFQNNVFESSAEEDTTQLALQPVYLFGLKQNYPNPFNSTTKISYAIPYSEHPHNVTIKVYDLLGQVVETLVNKIQSEGIYHIEFSSGNLPSGVYLVSLSNVEYTDTIKLIILK